MPPIIETVPFNFAEIETSLNQKFVDAGYDTSPGSNVSQLITAMAYLTSMMNVNTAVNINETVLSLATKRDNVLANARALGYEIQHKQSYTYTVTLTLSGAPNGNYTIPKYSMFSANGLTYYYMGTQIDLVGQADGSTIDILVVEGTLHRYVDFPDTLTTVTQPVLNEAGLTVPQYYMDLPFVDVEENGIECYVTYYDDFGNLVKDEVWTKSQQFMIDQDTLVKNRFFRQDNIAQRTPRIYFEISGVGTGLRLGTTINVNVLTTNGVNGAIATPGVPSTLTSPIQYTVVSNIALSSVGTDEETFDSIKLNAPKFYNSANRAVTANDYIAFSNRQTTIADTFVWGGDEENPKAPGHIWFSFLPSTTTRAFGSDVFNTEFLLNNSFFDTWDYSLLEGTQAFTDQYNASSAYYSNLFLQDAAIRSTQINAAGDLVQPGVWDVLDNYKIPTIVFHNRHPVYLDFEYDIQIMKYNIITSKADVHQNIFNVIDNFFTGIGDPIKMESFSAQYFHSSLQKRIDTVLTDNTGFNSTLTNNIIISQKNIANENYDQTNTDVFIPLSVPFEPYFDTNGVLLYNVLPSIDTDNFIDYRSATDIANGVNVPNTRLYVDWSSLQASIDAGSKQISLQIISVPIRIHMTESITAISSNNIVVRNFGIYPDDPTVLDTGSVGTYDKTVVTVDVGGTGTNIKTLTYGATVNGYTVSVVDTHTLILTEPVNATDVVTVQSDIVAGSYDIFNGMRKGIMVQLYVNSNSAAVNQPTQIAYTSPRSYLTTNDNMYITTASSLYFTTDGYTLTSSSQVSAITGPVFKTISGSSYQATPIKTDLFFRDRKLLLKYVSSNFQVTKNTIPRLKRVTFR